MELRLVRYFIAVAEYLNFSKAAEQLHIAQPPLSRQIRQLEDELGVQLFARNKRHVELTKAGRAFLEEARKLVVQAGHATEAARHAQKGESGLVKIGIASGLGGVVSHVVVEHQKRYPAIDLQCKDIFSAHQNEALRKCDIDVGFLRPPVDQVNLHCELLFEEKLVVILPKTHRLAKLKSLRLKDVADEPLIIFNRGFSSGLYDKILGLFNRRGLTPHLAVTHVEAHEEAGAIMVASGKAIFIGAGAIVTRSVAGIELASVELNEREAKIEVYVAWRKGEDSAAVFNLLDSVHRVFRPRAHIA
ncbi:MAG TPA: LysR substrate-binding domain-containing protein [Candidatus Polarisedimenticolia bacterium]|nr:LysR substrate-binding domain-containing protein [Candidatus Polarisedimenticolia bacterium]